MSLCATHFTNEFFLQNFVWQTIFQKFLKKIFSRVKTITLKNNTNIVPYINNEIIAIMKEKGRIRKYIQKLEAEVQTDEKHPI
jgi:hypothetical protein